MYKGGHQMELFDEVYNCYYQAVRHILEESKKQPLTVRQMEEITKQTAFLESHLTIVPKLIHASWDLMEVKDKDSYVSKLVNLPKPSLTKLQKSWLKSLLADKRISLFLTKEEQHQIKAVLGDTKPLYMEEDFYYFDRFLDGDTYYLETYQNHFQTVLSALEQNKTLIVAYRGRRGNQFTCEVLPYHIQYSSREDKFRVCCLSVSKAGRYQKMLFNINRILACHISNNQATMEEDKIKFLSQTEQANEAVEIEINGERNSLERCMLRFANYEKHTEYEEERNIWICRIYYDKMDEPELLLDLLSFGPVIKVTGPKEIVDQIKRRIKKQNERLYQPI